MKHGFHVVTLTGHQNLNEEEAQLNELIGYRVDGVIITSNVHIPKLLIQKLVDLKIPVVMIERTYDLPLVDRIQVDDLAGSFEAVHHIIDKGHQRIGFLGMQIFHDVEKLRYQGYCNAVENAGMEVLKEYVCFMPEYSVEAGYKETEMLMKGDPPHTAVFAISDLFICGVMQYLHQQEKQVPQDLSLVGYDDILPTLPAPLITSVGLSLEETGEQAIELLLRRMTIGQAPSKTVMIKTVLIDRQSVSSIS